MIKGGLGCANFALHKIYCLANIIYKQSYKDRVARSTFRPCVRALRDHNTVI